MASQLNPYLHFKDNTREAMEFYKTIFGGRLEVTTFKEGHMSEGPAEGDKVMHAMLKADNGMTFMAADTPDRMEYKPGSCISMSLSGDDNPELTHYYEVLSSDGGKATLPMSQAPWGDRFGMCTDKFGVNWMVNITVAQPS